MTPLTQPMMQFHFRSHTADMDVQGGIESAQTGQPAPDAALVASTDTPCDSAAYSAITESAITERGSGVGAWCTDR